MFCWEVGVQWLLFFAAEEAEEVKKSKLYQPSTKLFSVAQHVSPVSSAESKKSVSLSLICLFLTVWIQHERCTYISVLLGGNDNHNDFLFD